MYTQRFLILPLFNSILLYRSSSSARVGIHTDSTYINKYKNMSGGCCIVSGIRISIDMCWERESSFVWNIRPRPHTTNILTYSCIYIRILYILRQNKQFENLHPIFLTPTSNPLPSIHRLLTLYSIMTTKTSCLVYSAYIYIR